MKPIAVLAALLCCALLYSGCAASNAEFNRTYLPDAVPGSPQKTINLPQNVIEGMKEHLFLHDRLLPVSLLWIEEDNLLLTILSKDGDSVVNSYLISLKTGAIKQLDNTERESLFSRLERRVSVTDPETTGEKVAKTIVAVVVTLAVIAAAVAGGSGGGGFSSKHKYKATVQDNGFTLDLDISLKESRGSCTIRNSQTGEAKKTSFPWPYDVSEIAVRAWLNSWRISPDGQFLMIDGELVGPRKRLVPLIKHYKSWYSGFDVNPRWDTIVLLSLDKAEDRQQQYRIEFYPFSVPGLKPSASERASVP
jgi:hypothetical protein